MTRTRTDAPTASRSFRPWTDRLFQVGASITILAIVLYESSNRIYGETMGLRLAGIFLSVAGGVVLAVWAARRPEAGARRSGAFTLTCAIISLLAGGATYLIGQAIQSAMSLAVVGPAANLTMTLVVFGVISLLTGIIKRINA